MTGDEFVSRLEKVRPTAPGRWMARCPAHEDRTASLAVADDGERVLLHCFALCGNEQILGAMGLHWSALFRDSDWAGKSFQPPPRLSPSDALRALDLEIGVVMLCAEDMAAGKCLSDEDRERLRVAYRRLDSAIGIVRGKR